MQVANILEKTKCYTISAMQYANTEDWRTQLKFLTSDLGITYFNPYEKPFLLEVEEANAAMEEMSTARDCGNFDFLAQKMKQVRAFDLSMVDRSDFVVCKIIPSVPTIGTIEELATAVRAKKPVFVFVEGGKVKCPFWIFGMIPHEYIFNTIEEIAEILRQIDSGQREADPKYWRLLKPEFR